MYFFKHIFKVELVFLSTQNEKRTCIATKYLLKGVQNSNCTSVTGRPPITRFIESHLNKIEN